MPLTVKAFKILVLVIPKAIAIAGILLVYLTLPLFTPSNDTLRNKNKSINRFLVMIVIGTHRKRTITFIIFRLYSMKKGLGLGFGLGFAKIIVSPLVGRRVL